ncbi:PREDICTED: aminopeptidase N-like [Priapulus caudatus]|uniref:Aminopeptidase N-like n=1 Tax=Priapulus caudatus TaxID=37621 RepID=A0ABM1EF50_PRICU|nr:PREDICTED: aminopeptidase N-like [Priapulus caudatus]
MDTWTLQPGYPYVTVTAEDDCYVFTQHQFLEGQRRRLQANNSTSTSPSDAESGILYAIPLFTKQQEQPNSRPEVYWLTTKSLKIRKGELDGEAWQLVNKNAAGFYRVLHSETEFLSLVQLLKANITAVDVRSRAQFISDTYSFAFLLLHRRAATRDHMHIYSAHG